MPEFLFMATLLKALISIQFFDGKQQHTDAEAETLLCISRL